MRFTLKQNILPSLFLSHIHIYTHILTYTLCTRTMHCCIKKKWNGARKWNIRVVKTDGDRWVFIGARWNLNTTLPRIRIDSRSFHPSFEIGRLSLSAISRTVYIHVFITTRIEWKHSVLFLVSSSVPSHRMTFLPSRSPPASTHYDLLRSLSCRVASYIAA